MANELILGRDALRQQPRHGAAGDVALNVGVSWLMKDRLVMHAKDGGYTLKEIVNDALTEYLDSRGIE